MTTITKSIITFGAIAGVFGLAAFFGLTPFGKTIIMQAIGGSPAGSTFNTAKVAAIVMVPTSASATSSSILNGDANDRIITDGFVTCAGATTTAFAQTNAGLAAWTWTAATSSTNAPAVNTNTILALNVNVATGTYDAYTSTSTYTQVASRRWAAGSYLTFFVNGTTTPSISCVPGVHYISS